MFDALKNKIRCAYIFSYYYNGLRIFMLNVSAQIMVLNIYIYHLQSL
jgi:hypothetical protein